MSTHYNKSGLSTISQGWEIKLFVFVSLLVSARQPVKSSTSFTAWEVPQSTISHPMFSYLASNKSSTVLVISILQVICFLFFTGSIIRCMRRLEELLRQMCQAAKAIGNTELENKFAEGQYPVEAFSNN